MKGILGWIKSNLLIVASTVVILVALPLGWFFSSGWNAKIRAEQEKRATQAYNQIKNAKVTYVIPSLVPGEEAWSESRPPNRILTEFVQGQREQRLSQAQEIVEQVESFNQDGHGNMAPQLLPEPASPGAETRLKYEFLAKMAGDRQMGTRSAYLELLNSIGAGEPPQPVRLAETLADVQQRETERILAESGTGSLTPEQQEELRKLLMERRIAEAQRRAREISIYADLSSFSEEGFGAESATIPPRDRADRGTTQPPTLAEVFQWNFNYWVVSDLLRAIDRANTDAGGARSNIANAVVKRIEKLSVKKLPVEPEPETGMGMGMGMGGFEEEPMDEGASAGVDPSVSVTGRVSTEAYDVVPAKLTLIVDSRRLPEIFTAFAETNLMTVLDADISEVDVWEDLRRGYFYGSEAPIVRVDLEVETIWLRSWTTPIMPDEVKEALGVATEGDELEDDGG